MTTNVIINETLLGRAVLIGGLPTENETVSLALREFIEKRSRENIISSFNTVEYDVDYNYKKMRSRR